MSGAFWLYQYGVRNACFQILISFTLKFDISVWNWFNLQKPLKAREIRNLWVDHKSVMTFYEINPEYKSIDYENH